MGWVLGIVIFAGIAIFLKKALRSITFESLDFASESRVKSMLACLGAGSLIISFILFFPFYAYKSESHPRGAQLTLYQLIKIDLEDVVTYDLEEFKPLISAPWLSTPKQTREVFAAYMRTPLSSKTLERYFSQTPLSAVERCIPEKMLEFLNNDILLTRLGLNSIKHLCAEENLSLRDRQIRQVKYKQEALKEAQEIETQNRNIILIKREIVY